MEESFLKAYDEYADAIFRHILFRVNDQEQAKDLLQEVFVKTWDYLSRGKQVDNWRGFLYRVANNLVIDEWVKRKKIPESLDSLRESGFEASDMGKLKTDFQFQLEFEDLKKVLSELDEDFRQVIMMRYLDELSVKEIAGILGISENLASVRLKRGLAKLRKFDF